MTTFIGVASNPGLTASNITDAAFRTMCQRIHAAILGAGCVDPGDTGQTDLTTITASTTSNSDRGSRMYRFNDASQGTHPVYFKVWYGIGNNAARYRLKFQVGQGSNGANGLTGVLSGTPIVGGATTSQGTQTTDSQEYACHTDGFFGLFVGVGNTGPDPVWQTIIIERTRDPVTGAEDGDGIVTWSSTPDPATSGEICVVDVVGAGARSYNYDFQHTLPVLRLGDTTNEAGFKRIWPVWFDLYGVRQMWGFSQVRYNEVPGAPTTMQASPFSPLGQRTMVTLGAYGPRLDIESGSTHTAAALWE